MVRHMTVRRTALLVDDDRQVRWTLAMLLEDLGFQVKEVERPSEAVSALEGGTFDVLVTDIVMPEMDGWRLAEIIREKQPSLPVLYVSGFSSENTRPVERSRILWKPFTQAGVAAALSELLNVLVR